MSISEVELITIDQKNDGQRLDNFLMSRLRGVPRSHTYRIVRRGEVRVNGQRARVNRRLVLGDQVRIPPVRREVKRNITLPHDVLDRLRSAILYEDDSLLVVSKPEGIAVHGGSGLSYGLIEGLRQAKQSEPFLELVHRLDRDTSGILLVAKSRPVLLELHDLLKKGKIHKEYVALLHGRMTNKKITVDLPIQKNISLLADKVNGDIKDIGKDARTKFELIRKYSDMTLTKVILDTGRMHQIRKHAAGIGHPVAGDRKYGDFSRDRLLRKQGLKRLFLHARRLSFFLPSNNQDYVFEIPIPEELVAFMDRLK